MNRSTVLGIDIGGSHITAALIDLETRYLFPASLIRKQVDSRGTAQEIVASWGEVIQHAIGSCASFSGKMGIAIPGPFDYRCGVSLIRNQDKYDALYGLNVGGLLAKELSVCTRGIRFMNDAQSLLQGEVFAGAARGYKSALALTLGTGLGTAKFADEMVEDADLWHSPFKDGIAEDYLSTRWFVKRYLALSGGVVNDVKELAGLYEADPKVKRIFDEFGKTLADFLSPFICKDKPEVVVIGGNIANAYDLFFPELKKWLKESSIQIPLQKAELGEQAALIGAACCWNGSGLGQGNHTAFTEK